MLDTLWLLTAVPVIVMKHTHMMQVAILLKDGKPRQSQAGEIR